MMEPDLWGSYRTTFSHQHGPSHVELDLNSQGFPELNLELQYLIYYSTMEGVQTKMDNQWSSLTTSPGLGAAGTVDFAPQVTLGWWQACKHTKLLHNEDSSPICQSLLCKASWESEDLYGDYTGSAGGYMVEIESPNKSNAQGDQHTPITLIGSPIRGNRFQADVTVCSGPQPPFVESRDQPEYHTVGDPSLAAGRWFMDVETPSSIGHGSSRFSSSTVDDASRIFGPINCCAQQRPLHQNTASMEICLSSATCYSTYPSSPPSARYAPSITEEDHQRSIESASRTPESRRHAKDEFLIQAKQSGMSYREIRSKGHFKEAESTLRGRYRTLTKCREHRVRKPQWHTKDVSLQIFRFSDFHYSH